MKMRDPLGLMLVSFTLLSSFPALAQFTQQGPKLVATGAVAALQGCSVSISADGNTAIVGGAIDNSATGAAWVWTRSEGVWTQQGNKLVGSGGVGQVLQGFSVALSADGNTAIIGGFGDNSSTGAVWIWTRSLGVWTQQGPKLAGSDAVGISQQGISVSLSADGNTAIVGGSFDNSIGAAWIWTRSGGVWTQQGLKLVGSGAVGQGFQGTSVSLSGDGNTAIVGGYYDDSQVGAAWVWTRSGGVWTQQGPKLVGSGSVGNAHQGTSVSLSFDGNTAIEGGYSDDNNVGAVWVWTRSGGVWAQQGTKLVGAGGVAGTEGQGNSVSISADGNVAMVGGLWDSFDGVYGLGAAWFWTRSGGLWTQLGPKLVGSGSVGQADQGSSASLSADGNTAILGGTQDDRRTGAVWVFAKLPDLSITKVHTSHFKQGDKGDTYTITVSNPGPGPTSGTVTVTDVVPIGLTPTAPNGTFDGWSCSITGQTLTCTQNDVLASGASYPPITLMVDVANDASPSVTNTVTVSGGGEVNTSNDTASDITPIKAAFVPVTPIGVAAAAVSTTQVNINWPSVNGSASYQIDRQAAGGVFSQIGTSLTNTFSDMTASADSAYLYRVRAVNGAGVSSSSAADLATTVIFVDASLTPGILVKAVHLSQLRTAVNAVRLLAGLTAANFTDSATAGTTIQAVHVTELRSDLDAARGMLSLSTGGYTDSSLSGVAVEAVHFQELRDRVQ